MRTDRFIRDVSKLIDGSHLAGKCGEASEMACAILLWSKDRVVRRRAAAD